MLQARWDQLKTDVGRVQGARASLEKQLAQLDTQLADLLQQDELLELVANLFRTLIDKEVVGGVESVEKLLTEGLQAIFTDMDISVKSVVDISRGKVSVELRTLQTQPDGTLTEAESLDAFGGSVSTIQSVLLRIILMLKRGLRPILFLDESLAAVSENYVPAVGSFLARLCERVQMDILVVTHNPVLIEAAHKAYRIQKVGSAATFKELK